MDKKPVGNKIDVVIGGEIISLRSSESPEKMQRVASYVSEKMAEVKSKSVSAALDERTRQLLFLLNIAHDYLTANDNFKRVNGIYLKYANKLGDMEKEIATLTMMVKELQAENKELKKILSGSPDADLYPAESNIITLPKAKPFRKAAIR